MAPTERVGREISLLCAGQGIRIPCSARKIPCSAAQGIFVGMAGNRGAFYRGFSERRPKGERFPVVFPDARELNRAEPDFLRPGVPFHAIGEDRSVKVTALASDLFRLGRAPESSP